MKTAKKLSFTAVFLLCASLLFSQTFSENLLLSDAASGFGQNAPSFISSVKKSVTVTDRSSLLAALKETGPRLILVKGKIDMTDSGRGSLLPDSVKASVPRLDAKIAEITKNTVLPVSSYSQWKTKYTASFNYSENESGKVKEVRAALNAFWKNLIEIHIPSQTALIGITNDAEITGGSLVIKDAENVVIRNLKISNCYNPFPKLEDNDGLNADLDCLSLKGSKNIWIDHCTFYTPFSKDQIESDKYLTADGEKVKWQVYDGLLDLTNANDFVTISWCIFRNHDKTMLIGNSDKNDSDEGHQAITIHHCWFDGCNQRLPMVRFATLHLYNNLYTDTHSKGIDRRKNCHIYSENNVFSDLEKSVTNNTFGSFYDRGSINIKSSGLSASPEWIPSDRYSYRADPADYVEQIVKAGSGNSKSIILK